MPIAQTDELIGTWKLQAAEVPVPTFMQFEADGRFSMTVEWALAPLTNDTEILEEEGDAELPPDLVAALAGIALGYRWGNLRGEGEYLHRTTTRDDRDSGQDVSDEVTLAKLEQELEIVEGRIDDVLSHNVFANLYYDVASDSRFTPYLGIGGGSAYVSLDYFGRFKRNDKPGFITTFTDRDLNETIAGRTTIGEAKLSDTLLGYQVLAGVDYRVSDPFTVGLKVRWADFGKFEDGREWDHLRSHDSRVGRGHRVLYTMVTDDIQFWAISFSTRYQF